MCTHIRRPPRSPLRLRWRVVSDGKQEQDAVHWKSVLGDVDLLTVGFQQALPLKVLHFLVDWMFMKFRVDAFLEFSCIDLTSYSFLLRNLVYLGKLKSILANRHLEAQAEYKNNIKCTGSGNAIRVMYTSFLAQDRWTKCVPFILAAARW